MYLANIRYVCVFWLLRVRDSARCRFGIWIFGVAVCVGERVACSSEFCASAGVIFMTRPCLHVKHAIEGMHVCCVLRLVLIVL